MVISMAVNSLYNIVDSYFVAKMSEDALTALALVYPVQNLITAVAVGFGVGINATVAFFLGAKEQKRADAAATQGDGLQPAAWNHSDGCVHRWHADLPSDVFLG